MTYRAKIPKLHRLCFEKNGNRILQIRFNFYKSLQLALQMYLLQEVSILKIPFLELFARGNVFRFLVSLLPTNLKVLTALFNASFSLPEYVSFIGLLTHKCLLVFLHTH